MTKRIIQKAISCLMVVMLIMLSVMIAPLDVSASPSVIVDGECGANLTWTLDDNGTLTIIGTGEMSDYGFWIDNQPWYDYRNRITAVQINNGVTGIGSEAFRECRSLTSITIPDSVTSIGEDAFNKCVSLTSITLPDSVTSIGDFAFYECSALESIVIPNSMTDISCGAFSHCSALTSVTIPDSVTSIGAGAFALCRALTGIVLPDSVTSIGEDALYECSALESIVIPDGVTSIGKEMFYRCAALKSITLPDSVTSIGDFAFYQCSALKSIVLPDNVTSIGEDAFCYCTVLKSITLPDSVMSIGNMAFSNTAYYNNDANWINGVLYIGNHLIKAKNFITGSYSIRPGTLTIGDCAFEDCSALTGIMFPDGVTSIGDYAFKECSALTSIMLPDGLTSIGDWAFEYCFKIESITIPDSVTSIGRAVFSSTAYFNNDANWENGIFYIGNHLIEAKSSIAGSYSIRLGTLTIGDYAFYGCRVLTGIIIPDSVIGIGNYVFEDCNRLTIYGSSGSKAQKYAKEYIIPFEILHTVDEMFIDVKRGEWYVSAVQYAVDNSLFFGVSPLEFAPKVSMNRAMLVTVLWRMEGQPAVSAVNPFKDIPSGEWYSSAVQWAAANGIVYGMTNDQFDPKGNITREQMATILYRYSQHKGYDVSKNVALGAFPDGKETSDYAVTALSWAYGEGLITGVKLGDTDYLEPKGSATRAQVASILMRYAQRFAK